MKKINISPTTEKVLIILAIILGIYVTAVAFWRGYQDGKAEKAAKEKVKQKQIEKKQ